MVQFSQPSKIINKAGGIYIVTLTKGAAVNPGGKLSKGCSAYIPNEPFITANTPVILFTPINR